jgi:Fe-S cluster assembly protein SufD
VNTQFSSRFREAFDYISAAVAGAPERRLALERFLDAGLPTPREEAWKYTSLGHLERGAWHAPEHPAQAFAAEACPGTVVAFSDGRLAAGSPATARARSLAAGSAPAVRMLGTLAGDAALTQINRALWQDGLLLHVAAGETAAPLFMVHLATEADAMLHLRHLVVLEAGASAVLVEHYRGADAHPYWNNVVCEIALGEGARLLHLRLIEENTAATHTALTAVRQAADSRYHSVSVCTGGRLARQDTRVRLDAVGAACQLDGVFIADARRHIDQHLQVEHAAPRTTSRQTWRGIAAGRGRGIFDARVVVQAGASQADARQSSRNLLLSPYAEIDVKPQLQIHTDDVRCSHGATVGQLDEAQVFYLRSRGIDAAAARAMLLRSFAAEALGLLDGSELAGWLAPRLDAALPVHGQERTA